MAKLRKQKSDGQKTTSGQQSDNGVRNLCAVVRHQKICLSVDMEKQLIYGHTELKVLVPEIGVIGLYASGMNINSIVVDGLPARFEFYPQHKPLQDEKRWLSITCNDAADVAGSAYFSSLEREMAPNLHIFCSKSVSSDSEVQDPADTEKTGQLISTENKPGATINNTQGQPENVKLVRIEYWLEKAEVGAYFMGNVMHTNNQIRRARCWFPCVDCHLQQCCYDMEFTVDSKYVAVSNGTLLYQVLSKDDPLRKTFVYSLNIPVAAEFISLTVAPFEVLPDRHNGVISHLCMPVNISKLQCTVSCFYSIFSYYEEYLAAPFPFGSYKQVFIDSETALSSTCVGASLSILSSHLLFDERVIDQTISTRVKLAHALAQQWFGVYITAETANDGWLLEGLAGFLTDSYIKRFLGNNEARYRRYKANEAVCKVDVDGATALSLSAASANLYGTQSIGVLGKIRSWKAVAVLQMLEKQMGPESFRKILQRIIHKAHDTAHMSRSLSTKEFRHFANKIGNLERPFLKEFFPRWVESYGCPVLRMGLSYNKRRNMIELAVLRGCTSTVQATSAVSTGIVNGEFQAGDVGWPGMMSIRVYELDGMYDHPSLPMAGDTCQLLEIQCHSKLASRRIQRPKKGCKADGSDDNGEAPAAIDTRPGVESPLLWLRADPEMEYLAEINIHQPVQMWINQLEKEKDVVAQLQAISTLRAFPQVSFAIVNVLSSCLNDSKVFWRVRIEAAFALAKTATEETDWAGLSYLIKFYKSRRFDPDIGLPRPNDFHDFAEYFVLEAIPHAVAMTRGSDGKSPPEAVDFILQLLKYNDNSGNPYSDVYWLAALVESIGKIEFGPQNIQALSPLLKRIDCLLQFDRLMPSYNGVLTISCIRTLTQVALKLSHLVPLERVEELIKPFQDVQTTPWQIRVEAKKALIDLEVHMKGLNVALLLAVKLIEEEPSLRVQRKVAMHCLHRCQMKNPLENTMNSSVLVALLRLLGSRKAFNNVTLRHHVFCVLQTLAGRSATLFGVQKPIILPVSAKPTDVEALEQKAKSNSLKLRFSRSQEPNPEPVCLSSNGFNSLEAPKDMDVTVSGGSGGNERKPVHLKLRVKLPEAVEDVGNVMDPSRSAGLNEKGFPTCPVTSSSMSVEAGLRVDATLEGSPCSPGGEAVEIASIQECEQKTKEATYGSYSNGSHLNVSISSAKVLRDYENANDLQCTADSMNVVSGDIHSPQNAKDTETLHGRATHIENLAHSPYFPVPQTEDTDYCRSEQYGGQQQELKRDRLFGESTLLMTQDSVDKRDRQEKKRKDRKDKEERKDKRKREKDKHDGKHDVDGHRKHRDKHNDPEYLERKRLKKERKRREKELLRMQKMIGKELLADVQNLEPNSMQRRPEPTEANSLQRMSETVETSSAQSRPETTEASSAHRKPEVMESSSGPKIRIKIKNRSNANS